MSDEKSENEKRDLSGLSFRALLFKQALLRACVKTLRVEERTQTDEVLEKEFEVTRDQLLASTAKYQGQLRQITSEIRRRKRKAREDRGDPKPENRLINAKTASLGAKKNG
jgi:hypothetical protein